MSRSESIIAVQTLRRTGETKQEALSNARKIPRLGISQCLLGDHVRYDGGHKRDRFLSDRLSQFVEWIPICPEVEAGLGIPREAMRLVGTPEAPRLMTIKTQNDHTATINRFCHRKIHELKSFSLDGFVFKKDSPSCGIKQVRVYQHGSSPSRKGRGLFAQAFQTFFPLIPIEDEDRLKDPGIRQNFLERVFAYHRWQIHLGSRLTRGGLVGFHTHHKYLLLAHSRPHHDTLGHLVASANHFSPKQLALQYGAIFMEALKVKTTVRKHVNVLQHLVGHFKKQISQDQRIELQDVISDFHRGLTPLTTPLTLINHYVGEHQIDYLAEQVYLHPHPNELFLKNDG
jgi:uncharacterized protein YbgA (DUF1722 family)/uncharacterized protein YbbK (DUF523 family)